MPLPLLAVPYVLGGAAALAGAVGIKKGYDAKCDYDDAEYYNNKAKRIYDEAYQELDTSRQNTNERLEDLGKLKISIYEESLADFVDIFSKMKNVDFEDNIDLGTKVDMEYSDILNIKDSVLEIKDVLGGGIAALGSGAIAGFGATGSVGLLATASTGTAISTLSGAAATNATLAWLGGGAIAAGGGGIALGTAVLGGLVAGPVLAVGGMVYAAKAEEAKNEAEANLDKAKAYVEEMKTAIEVVDDIKNRVIYFKEVLLQVNEVFDDYIERLDNIVDREVDYSKYKDKDKRTVMIVASIAKTIKNLCDAPIIDENGEVTRKSKRVLKKSREFIETLERI